MLGQALFAAILLLGPTLGQALFAAILLLGPTLGQALGMVARYLGYVYNCDELFYFTVRIHFEIPSVIPSFNFNTCSIISLTATTLFLKYTFLCYNLYLM